MVDKNVNEIRTMMDAFNNAHDRYIGCRNGDGG